ncbi:MULTISPECIES: CDP-alcohol phosphatidyltransferase [unclassified Streptomyces]|uniref:CDP-alcohol phosphatidyltransferase n=1 Tax=unclassified Streptomyces TaxID=2593676 RepID=UPI000F6DCCDC|nr:MULTISPECIES: CDP-alcohol phosphatidyltransferase [unclassified Streptomyces]AZM62429.1 CDP-alcohol phosphatidyltransferase [Streptomyces sp. WAC 01438]RSM93544.1 CDP-alcohol phosphatidyltransferase [Streptomyces sp. WAC 01420]
MPVSTRVLGRARTRLRALRIAHPGAARTLRLSLHVLAAVLVVGALLLPNSAPALRPNRFTRIPAEAIIGAVLVLALPRRPRVVAAALCGAGIGVLTVLNLLDIGFTEYLGRGFNLVLDWGLLDDGLSYVEDAMGGTAATAAAVGAILLALAIVVVMALAAVRLGNLLARHRARATRGALIAGTAWVTCTALGLQIAGVPVASDRAAGTVKGQTERVVNTLRDEAAFAKEARADTFGATPPDQLLPDLRGKDVVIAFIESYGRSAVEDPEIAPGVTRTLDARTAALAKAGYRARSGWLTSATYGGSSWLGHSTALSGLWIDNQQRYRTVTHGDHLTLTKAFRKTGAWETVGIMPGVQKAWPEAEWYGLDRVYDAFELGYRGPKFSWSTMPDQYALEAFERLEHGRTHDRPLMSEIILTSSHQPWAPVPELVDWDDLGDGSVFDAIQRAGKKSSDVIADSAASRREYGRSIQYSVTSLTQWLERYGTDDTVLVFLGDHQPIARVSGHGASRDVPVTIVAKDPEVLAKTDGWNWTEGLRPAKDAPVWRMSSFRDRFLTAFGSVPHPTTG